MAMKKTFVEKFVEDIDNLRVFQQERAIVEVTDLLESALEQSGISRSEFARMLGKSKGWVTQLLDGEGNKTVRTIADAFAVLGLEYRSFYQPIAISNKRRRATEVPQTIASVSCGSAPSPSLRLYQTAAATTVAPEVVTVSA
jgi:hypothetical protein